MMRARCAASVWAPATRRIKQKNIAEIFRTDGEAAFRDLEAAELAATPAAGWIVAAGGGIVLRPENRLRLSKDWCAWLVADAETLAARISGDSNRPALTGLSPRDEVAALLAARSPLYEEVARARFEAFGRPPAAVADEIAEAFRSALPRFGERAGSR